MVEAGRSFVLPMSSLTQGNEFDVAGFINALAWAAPEERKGAVKHYLNSAFVDKDAEHPSPRAKGLVESGEWEKHDVLLVRLDQSVIDGMCCSHMGDR